MTAPIHTSDFFTVHGKSLITEISDLPRPVMGQIYTDACDLGFFVKSERTGKIEGFRMREEKRDVDGDIQVWILEPVNFTLRNKGVEVHVLND